MDFKPAMGTLFLTPVDDIPSGKVEVGFGGKTEKLKPETPYKFKVVGVGGSYPINGVVVEPEVEVGDIVSTNDTNASIRETKDVTGFTIDGVWYFPVDFRHILGIWETDEQRQEKINRRIDSANAAYRALFNGLSKELQS